MVGNAAANAIVRCHLEGKVTYFSVERDEIVTFNGPDQMEWTGKFAEIQSEFAKKPCASAREFFDNLNKLRESMDTNEYQAQIRKEVGSRYS